MIEREREREREKERNGRVDTLHPPYSLALEGRSYDTAAGKSDG